MFYKQPNTMLKEILVDRGIKQVELAFHLEIPISKLCLYANGWEIPPVEQQERIAKALGCDPEDLGWSD